MRADAREEEARGLGRRERAARGVLEFSCSSMSGSRVSVAHRAVLALLVSRERPFFDFGIFLDLRAREGAKVRSGEGGSFVACA